MKPRIAKQMPQHTRPKREGMDAAHLVNVRYCRCLCCGTLGSHMQAHHLLRTDERGLSRKSSDRWAVPLCPLCHQKLHSAGDEEAFFAEHGIDGRAVASSLWAARGDVERMKTVAFKACQVALLKRLRATNRLRSASRL